MKQIEASRVKAGDEGGNEINSDNSQAEQCSEWRTKLQVSLSIIVGGIYLRFLSWLACMDRAGSEDLQGSA
jgi:hypothetical protein